MQQLDWRRESPKWPRRQRHQQEHTVLPVHSDQSRWERARIWVWLSADISLRHGLRGSRVHLRIGVESLWKRGNPKSCIAFPLAVQCSLRIFCTSCFVGVGELLKQLKQQGINQHNSWGPSHGFAHTPISSKDRILGLGPLPELLPPKPFIFNHIRQINRRNTMSSSHTARINNEHMDSEFPEINNAEVTTVNPNPAVNFVHVCTNCSRISASR